MHTLLETKIGPFLVVFSVLALWALLAARPVQAQTFPSCQTSSDFIADKFESDGTTPVTLMDDEKYPVKPALRYDRTLTDGFSVALTDNDVVMLTDRKTDSQGTETQAATYYRAIVRIVVPENTAGRLTVSTDQGSPVSGGILCRSSTSTVDRFGYTITQNRNSPGTPDVVNVQSPTELVAEQASPGTYYAVIESRTVRDGEDDTNGDRVAINTAGAITSTSIEVAFEGVMPNEDNPSSDGDIGAGDFIEHAFYVVGTDTVGLLTARTTGSTDTTGTLLSGTTAIATAKDGGSGGNFQMDVPVNAGEYTVEVSGGDEFETGLYRLVVDFKVATPVGTVSITDDGMVDGNVGSNTQDDYFWFLAGVADQKGHLTVQTTGNTQTRGTLYWPSSERQTEDAPSTTNFEINVPVYVDGSEEWKRRYIVQVEGRSSTGDYTLEVSLQAAEAIVRPITEATDVWETDQEIAARGTRYYVINVTKAGTLSIEARNPTNASAALDSRGFLEGADGQLIAQNSAIDDDNDHFRIVQSVMPGRYILRVKGQTDRDAGSYDLVTSFIEAEVDSVTPTDPVDPPECPEPEMLPVDATGALENPSGGGFRSGIGIISGWACSANEVEVVISSNDRQGSSPVTLAVAYGTSRPDTVGQCRHNDPNTGFGMTYNFNHLREGEYTMRAFADGEELIGAAQTFNVVHLTTFAVNDDDRFLRDEDLLGTECRVDDFPDLGEATILEWEQSTQNFVIIDAGPVSQ